MHLPLPIERYFEADNRGDAERLLVAFAPDAMVKDEGVTYRGHSEIASWWRKAKAKYQHSAAPLHAEGEGAATKVRATLTGKFPGSPAVLTFAFDLEGDRITRLEIGA